MEPFEAESHALQRRPRCGPLCAACFNSVGCPTESDRPTRTATGFYPPMVPRCPFNGAGSLQPPHGFPRVNRKRWPLLLSEPPVTRPLPDHWAVLFSLRHCPPTSSSSPPSDQSAHRQERRLPSIDRVCCNQRDEATNLFTILTDGFWFFTLVEEQPGSSGCAGHGANPFQSQKNPVSA